jgi:hypothetical protein
VRPKKKLHVQLLQQLRLPLQPFRLLSSAEFRSLQEPSTSEGWSEGWWEDWCEDWCEDWWVGWWAGWSEGGSEGWLAWESAWVSGNNDLQTVGRTVISLLERASIIDRDQLDKIYKKIHRAIAPGFLYIDINKLLESATRSAIVQPLQLLQDLYIELNNSLAEMESNKIFYIIYGSYYAKHQHDHSSCSQLDGIVSH